MPNNYEQMNGGMNDGMNGGMNGGMGYQQPQVIVVEQQQQPMYQQPMYQQNNMY